MALVEAGMAWPYAAPAHRRPLPHVNRGAALSRSRSGIHEHETHPGLAHGREVRIGRKNRQAMAERESCDQEVERLDDTPAPPEGVAKVAGLYPEVRRILDQPTTRKQRKDECSLRRRTQSATKLGDDGSAERNIIGREQAIDNGRERLPPPKEVNPG
jgi:hypothetical protein